MHIIWSFIRLVSYEKAIALFVAFCGLYFSSRSDCFAFVVVRRIAAQIVPTLNNGVWGNEEPKLEGEEPFNLKWSFFFCLICSKEKCLNPSNNSEMLKFVPKVRHSFSGCLYNQECMSYVCLRSTRVNRWWVVHSLISEKIWCNLNCFHGFSILACYWIP